MSFAVVELKYMPKKTFIVPITWIKNYVAKHLPTVEFYCYISTNLKDDPNFQAKYYIKFTGTAGLFKVFVLTVTDSIIDAVIYQEQKRIKSVSVKFRQPANTEAELNAENAKRKKKENIIKKGAKQSAKVKNMAHLADVLINETATNIASKTIIQAMNTGNIQGNDSDNFPANMLPIQVIETKMQNQTFDSATSNMTHNDVEISETEMEKQPIISIICTSTDISPNDAHVLGTGIQSPPIIVPFDPATATMPPNGAEVSKIQNRAAIVPMELPSVLLNNYPDIVRLAMEGLEGVDFLNNCDLDFAEGIDIDASTSEGVQNMTETIFIDVPLNTCNLGNVYNMQGAAPDNSLSISSISSLPKPQINKKEMMQEHRVGEIDYKKAYLELQAKNASLDERNLALQNALVAANKASAKVPQVPFTEKDGGRLYAEGVFFHENQCKALDATRDNNKFVNNLAIAVFGSDTLKKSSVTGTSSKNYGFPAKPGLNPIWLQLFYDLIDAKTNKSLSKSDINKILNKKISNLVGAEKRKMCKINGEGKRKVEKRNQGIGNDKEKDEIFFSDNGPTSSCQVSTNETDK